MIAFDGIRRIYYLPYLLRIFEKYSQFSPVFIPEFQDIRVFFIPLFAELFLGKFSVVKVHSAVDFIQVSADFLAVFVRHELAAVDEVVENCEYELYEGYIKLAEYSWKTENGKYYFVDPHIKGEVLGEEVSSWVELNIVDGVMDLTTLRIVKDE